MKAVRGDNKERSLWLLDRVNEIGMKGRGAVILEIGVWKADFGDDFLKRDANARWIGVDPYAMYEGKRQKVKNQELWDAIYERVLSKMEPWGGRFTLIRKRSSDAAGDVPEPLDGLFIDGDHIYNIVKEDMALYIPKVRRGGLVSGHDYQERDVKAAVDEYTGPKGIRVNLETFHGVQTWWWRRE